MVGRLDTRDCFFAVKKNVDEIKREEFKEPKKSDDYSTSVLGIQFTRGNNCTVQIISRYNHTVENPNCTLGNDLDRLAPGLEQSFSNLLAERGLTLNNSNKEGFSIPGYTIGNDSKYYKYNMEIDGNYYCPGNIIISNGEVTSVSNPEEGLLIDYFFLDKKNKKIKVIADRRNDSFVDDLQDIEKVEVVKSKEGNIDKLIKIHLNDIDMPVIIGIDKDNQIVKYENKNITNIRNNFLHSNKGLTELELPNLTQVGENFMGDNEGLTQLELPNLIQVGGYFLFCNKCLTHLELPNLKKVGACFLNYNEDITYLKLPNLTQAGASFLFSNKDLTHLELPSLKQVDYYFLNCNKGLTQLELQNLKQVGDYFLNTNKGLTHLELPNLKKAGHFFLKGNQGLTHLKLPSLKKVGVGFLRNNNAITHVELPKSRKLRKEFSYRISKNKKTITSKNIAQLDRDNELTTSEINLAHKIIEKIKGLFKKEHTR